MHSNCVISRKTKGDFKSRLTIVGISSVRNPAISDVRRPADTPSIYLEKKENQRQGQLWVVYRYFRCLVLQVLTPETFNWVLSPQMNERRMRDQCSYVSQSIPIQIYMLRIVIFFHNDEAQWGNYNDFATHLAIWRYSSTLSPSTVLVVKLRRLIGAQRDSTRKPLPPRLRRAASHPAEESCATCALPMHVTRCTSPGSSTLAQRVCASSANAVRPKRRPRVGKRRNCCVWWSSRMISRDFLRKW